MNEIIINGIIEESQEMSGQIQYARGPKGDDGIGIQDIQKTSTVGKVDTYTITLTNGTTKIFTVTNGNDGSPGSAGVSVSSASINSSGHLILTLNNGTSVDAGVAKGDSGDSGVYIGSTPPTDPNVKVWIDTSGSAGDVEMTSNKTTTLSTSSTDTQYPSAKSVYDVVSSMYTKPATGIPKTDLASDVQASLEKVDKGALTNARTDTLNFTLDDESGMAEHSHTFQLGNATRFSLFIAPPSSYEYEMYVSVTFRGKTYDWDNVNYDSSLTLNAVLANGLLLVDEPINGEGATIVDRYHYLTSYPIYDQDNYKMENVSITITYSGDPSDETVFTSAMTIRF